jgi:putative DNA-invertase from lambdoid prophage Rac
MAVYGYVRVSTIRQSDDGESLDVQQRTISGYVQMHGLALDKVFVERGVSGSKPLSERPHGAALLAALKPGDVVIAAKLDRIFRSALDALDVLSRMWERHDVALHLIDLGGDISSNGISKLVFTILSAVAEAERDRIRERVTEVKRDQRQRGHYLGGKIPFGWSVGNKGELVPIPEQQAALKRMRKMRAEGIALRTIAEKMAAAGIKISHEGVKGALAAADRLAGPGAPAGFVEVCCLCGRRTVSPRKAPSLPQMKGGCCMSNEPPFGWRVGDAGKLVVDPKQQGARRRMWNMWGNRMSLHDIAERMREHGFSLSPAEVEKILKSSGRRPTAG